MTNISEFSLTELASGIKKKDFTSEEVTKSFISNSQKSKKLNAYITECFDDAIKSAKDFDKKKDYKGLLSGIPIAVKDLFCTKNIKTTAGSKILHNFIPTYESTVTNNLWSEGAFLLGKLNCDEFAMGSSNETSFFGNVINPFGDKLVPGGSSGGSASALAADLTPGTIGTDTGGSIRQPASFTGTVGLKPTYGRCSRWGIVAFASSLDQAGPMTKNVEDSALLLQAMAGYDAKDSTSVDIKVENYISKLTDKAKGLKIGIPKEYIPGVEKGLKSSKESGVLAGFPVIDFKAVLKDGAFHDVDSSVLAFEIAAKAAFREGISAAGPVLLEPMMSVEVVTPEGYMGDVIGDLNSRRGQVSESEKRANAQVIKAMVPLANMFGYVNNLRSMSQGRASYSMEFDHYQQVPQQVAEEVREKLSG